MNLGLLALSDDVELKIKAICVKSNCPYIMEPYSKFRIFCDSVVLVAVVLQSIVLPYNIAFKRKIPTSVRPVSFLFDCLYVLDIYLQLSTMIKGRVHIISTTTAIIMHRFRQLDFLIDLVAVLPTDYIGVALGASSHIEALLRINRLLKLHKLYGFMISREKDFRRDYLKIQLIKYISLYLFVSKYL